MKKLGDFGKNGFHIYEDLSTGAIYKIHSSGNCVKLYSPFESFINAMANGLWEMPGVDAGGYVDQILVNPATYEALKDIK